MNLKSIIISIGLIFTMISSGLGIKYFEKPQTENNEQNIIADNVIQDEQTNEEETIDEEVVEEIVGNSDITENVELQDNQKEDTTSEQPKVKSEYKSNESTSNTAITETKEDVPVKENNQTSETKQTNQVVETPKVETKPKELTPDDLEYWCIAGGTHHVAGDGANEHGYYSTWDEAYNAFLSYTASWSSSQYKVSCCSCGLYYFWAIQ